VGQLCFIRYPFRPLTLATNCLSEPKLKILRTAKLLTLSAAKSVGLFDVLRRSEWRKNQLLILAYHGVSQDDEHLWNPELFVSPDCFATRMRALKNYGCKVLQLNDAIQMLYAKCLPPCSVVLTFDDGSCDFYHRAFPILRDFDLPATVYLTSYYSAYNRPVFDVMCSYLLWKGRRNVFDATDLIGQPAKFHLEQPSGRERAANAIRQFAEKSCFTAKEKDDLLGTIADRLRVDYETILSKRILHLLSAAELVELSREGVDIQLHTHRHRTPIYREPFLAELAENRSFITRYSKMPHHFSYPNGRYERRYDEWLYSSGVMSATTCEPGLATKHSNPYKLPRLVDNSLLQLLELEGWVSGFSKFLPLKAES